MRISILTLFPKMMKGFFEESIVKRAQDRGFVEIEIVNLRDFAKDSYGSVDDKPYGGGAGMILRVDVLSAAINKIKDKRAKSKDTDTKSKIVLTSAKGKRYNQKKAQELSKVDNLVIIAGHYEGVDERIMEEIDEEISLGDFVMTGGEIAAAAVTDSVVRLLPGVLKKESATEIESFLYASINQIIKVCGEHPVLKKLKEKGFTEVTLLEYPHYTRPEEFKGQKVPEILLSGNHAEIEKWRIKKAFEETLAKRPDLLKGSDSFENAR